MLVDFCSFGKCLAFYGLMTACAEACIAHEVTNVRRDATVDVVEKVMPCVVNIATETIMQVQDQFQSLFGPYFAPYRRQQAQHSLGSGVIIDDESYPLTNDHVVRRAEKIWVKVYGRDEPYSAKLVTEGLN